MSEKVIESGTIADAYIEILADRGVDFLFANAGTDFAPLIESLSKFEAQGRKMPRPVTVPHENVAIHMALGYYLQTGKPQLVMVHVNVGMANAMCGVLNAWRGNLPVVFTSGRTPYSEEGGLMGARSGEIHWPQEMRDQAGMLREIVKWDYELKNAQVLESAVDRAFNLTMSEPKGPVYLALPREVLAAPIENFKYSSPSRHAAASAPFPDLDAIDRAADMIAKAENPLIITASCGRDHDEPARLAALAELFAIPVTQRKPRYMALPTDHPMHLGFEPDAFLGDADLIVVIDADVPWIPHKKAPGKDCKIIHLGVDPLYTSYPLRGFPCDLAISGSIGPSMAALANALETRLGPARDRIEARRRKLGERRAAQRERWAATLEKAKTEVADQSGVGDPLPQRGEVRRRHHPQGRPDHLRAPDDEEARHAVLHGRGRRAGLEPWHGARHEGGQARTARHHVRGRRRVHVRQSDARALCGEGGRLADADHGVQQRHVGRGEAQHARGVSVRLRGQEQPRAADLFHRASRVREDGGSRRRLRRLRQRSGRSAKGDRARVQGDRRGPRRRH